MFKGHLETAIVPAARMPADAAALLCSMVAKQAEERPDALRLCAALQALVQAHGLTVSCPVGTTSGQPPAETGAAATRSLTGAALFADMFNNDAPPAAPPAVAPVDVPTPTASPVPARPTHDVANIFGQGFEETPLLAASATRALECAPMTFGQIQLTPQWSRAVDSKSLRFANLDNNQELLIVTQIGVHGLNAQASKGDVWYQGALERLGTPSHGILPVLNGRDVFVLQPGEAAVERWALDVEAQQVCFAPEAQAAAVVVGQTVSYYDHAGTLCWSGMLEAPAAAVCVTFDHEGELMVLGYDSEVDILPALKDGDSKEATHVYAQPL